MCMVEFALSYPFAFLINHFLNNAERPCDLPHQEGIVTKSASKHFSGFPLHPSLCFLSLVCLVILDQ